MGIVLLISSPPQRNRMQYSACNHHAMYSCLTVYRDVSKPGYMQLSWAYHNVCDTSIGDNTMTALYA